MSPGAEARRVAATPAGPGAGAAVPAFRPLLVRMSAALGAGDPRALARAVDEAAGAGVDATAVEEALLQSLLFVGFPKALEALALWRARTGLEAPDAPVDAHGPGAGADAWLERGEEVCRAVYGDQYGPLRENMRELHPDADRWMVETGYGRVLGRPGLDLASRELCIVALLAVQHAPRQLYSHLRGALRAGATEGEVDDALDAAAALTDEAHRRAAADTWDAVRSRRRPGREG